MLEEAAPGGEFLWSNKVLVHLIPPQRSEPWATLLTKKTTHVELLLYGPKDKFPLGRVVGLARDREVDATDRRRDVVRLRFRNASDLERGDLKQFLQEHAASLNGRVNVVRGRRPIAFTELVRPPVRCVFPSSLYRR